MTAVSILPISNEQGDTVYRAVAGQRESVGKTAGEALDALNKQLAQGEGGTLVVIQHFRPARLPDASGLVKRACRERFAQSCSCEDQVPPGASSGVSTPRLASYSLISRIYC